MKLKIKPVVYNGRPYFVICRRVCFLWREITPYYSEYITALDHAKHLASPEVKVC